MFSTELYLIYLELALSNKRQSKMADLNAVGGRLAAEVNGFSLCKPSEILQSEIIYVRSSVISFEHVRL